MEKRRVYIGGFKEFPRNPLPQPGVFIAHDFSGRDREDDPRDAPRQVTDYRLAYDDGLREADFHPIYAPVHSGTILETLVKEMVNTDAGIFDISFGRKYNSNVLIELGISIGLNHPTLVVAEEADRPLLDFLDALDVFFYKNDDDLAMRVGDAVRLHINDFNPRLSPYYCVTCKREHCACRKQLTQLEKTYLLLGTDDNTSLQRHMRAVAKEFDLRALELAPVADHPSTICTWLYNIKRSKFVLLYSKELGRRHHGKENAATMIQLGLALGANIPWRFVIAERETPPTDVINYVDVRVAISAETTRSNLRGAIGALNNESNPYHGIYDILPPPEYVDEEVLGIDEEPPSKPKIFMAPALSPNFTVRQEIIDTTVKQVIANHVRASSTAAVVGVSGAGGLGKTTLAVAVCHDEKIQRTFVDGILWFLAGEYKGVLNSFVALIRAISGDGFSVTSLQEAQAKFVSLISSASFLIVLDGVKSIEDIRPFIVPNTKSSYLITTRNASILQEINATAIQLDKLSEAEAIQLLTLDIHRGEIEINLSGLKELASKADYSPLGLKFINGQLRERLEEGLTLAEAIQHTHEQLSRSGASGPLSESLRIVMQTLSERIRNLFQQLAVFAEDANIPITSIGRLWKLDSVDVTTICSHLATQSLLDFSNDHVYLHDLIRSYLIEQSTNLPQLHMQLLEAWGDKYNLPDAYAWQYYVYHSIWAGSDARLLLMDKRWIQAKLKATNLDALLEDFALFPNDQILQKAVNRIRVEHDSAVRRDNDEILSNSEMTGTIKKIMDKGFGFIASDDSSRDIFFLIKNLVDWEADEVPLLGQRVKFEISEGDKGVSAINVRKIDLTHIILQTAQTFEQILIKLLDKMVQLKDAEHIGFRQLWDNLEKTNIAIPSEYTKIVNRFWELWNSVLNSNTQEVIDDVEIEQILQSVRLIIDWLDTLEFRNSFISDIDILDLKLNELERDVAGRLFSAGWNEPPFSLKANEPSRDQVYTDFILVHEGIRFIAVVEVKGPTLDLEKVKERAIEYRENRHTKIAFVVDGDNIIEIDPNSGQDIFLDEFPSAKSLLDRSNNDSSKHLPNPFAPVLSADFIDRQMELQVLIGRVQNGLSSVVIGKRKIGKTSILMRVLEYVRTLPGYVAIYLSADVLIGDDKHAVSFLTLLARSLSQSTDVDIPTSPDDNPQTMGSDLLKNITNGFQNQKLVIIIDEIEGLFIRDDQDALFLAQWLRGLVNYHVVLIVASSHEMQAIEPSGRSKLVSPFYNVLEVTRLEGFDFKATGTLVNRHLGELSNDLVNFIFQETKGEPYLVQQFCLLLIERQKKQQRKLTLSDLNEVKINLSQYSKSIS